MDQLSLVFILDNRLLIIPPSGVSTISLGHLVMVEGKKWARNESMLILILYLIAEELDG